MKKIDIFQSKNFTLHCVLHGVEVGGTSSYKDFEF